MPKIRRTPALNESHLIFMLHFWQYLHITPIRHKILKHPTPQLTIYVGAIICEMGLNKNKHRGVIKKTSVKHRYDLSFKRVISRLFITGVVGLIFGVAMLPFMRVADGLLYMQRASIGTGNMVRAVVLWGIFTVIVTFLTFWKRKFRMVSILLIGCFVLSLLLVGYVSLKDDDFPQCNRSTPYTMPAEFDRAMDHIVQRMEIDTEKSSGSYIQSAFNFRNCLDIQYLDTDDPDLQAYFESPFEKDEEYLQDLKIWVNPSFKKYDDLTLAMLLTHEIVHAGEYVGKFYDGYTLNCFQEEEKAFVSQHGFLISLNEEEQRSIYTRLNDDVDRNPTFKAILLTGQRANESYGACKELQLKTKLSDEQLNKCAWDGLENLVLKDVQNDSYYQKQCESN